MNTSLFYILLICLVSWKFNLIPGASDKTSGVRLDDFIIFLSFIYFFLVKRRVVVTKELMLFFLFILVSLASVFYNSILSSEVSIIEGLLFSFRSLEYWVFMLFGYFLYEKSPNGVMKVIFIYFFYLAAVIILQKIGVIGAVSNFGGDRLSGNLGGPWELAQICSFYCIFFLILTNEKANKYKYFFIVAFIFLFFSGSRVTLVGTVIVVALYLIYFSKINMKKVLALFLFIPLFFSLSLLFKNIMEDGGGPKKESVIDRFDSFNVTEVFDYVGSFYSSIPIVEGREEFKDYNQRYIKSNINQFDGDASAYARFTRWILAYKTWGSQGLGQYFIGNSPGYYGYALDGNYLRILFETGLFGFVLFFTFIFYVLVNAFKSITLFYSKLLFFYTISLVLTALLIDIFFTYKAMLLFWLLYGASIRERSEIR